MTLLQHHILAERLIFITTLILGSFVLWKNSKRVLNRVFFFYSLSIAGWSLTESLGLSAPNGQNASALFFFEIAPVSFLGTLFLHFNYLLSEKPLTHQKKKSLLFAYSFSILFSVIGILQPTLLLNGVGRSHYLPYFSNPGLLYPAWTFGFLAITILGNFELLRLYIKSEGEQRNRLKYFVWSTVAGYIGGTPDWLLGYRLHVPGLNPFGLYAVSIYAILTAYAILQHQLFEINLVIRKSLIYSLLVTLLTVGYFGTIYLVEQIFQATWGYRSPAVSVAGFALMALLFQPLKVTIQRFVDWLIFRVPQEELVRRIERLERETRETEKLRAVATMAAGLCHELRNPLQIIQTHAEFLPERYSDPDFLQQCSKTLRTETTRINTLLKELMDFAKPKPAKLRPVEPHTIVDSTLNLLNADLLKHKITLERQYLADGAKILADPDQIRQVVLNLVLNSMEAIGQGGNIAVRTHQDGVWFVLEVRDTGPGISPKILSKLFQPFTTTKADGNGLGLSVAHSIVQSHQGKISAESKPGEGTCFTVKLPLD